MTPPPKSPAIAFEGFRLIASGDLAEVALEAKKVLDRGERAPVLIFDSATSEQLRSRSSRLAGRSEPAARHRAGASRTRPAQNGGRRAGSHPAPRHWDWLNQQPGGASVALRRLVDEARRTNAGRDRTRQAQDAAYRFMMTMAGNHPGFEEAIRCLYSGNRARFDQVVENWPADVRDHVEELAEAAFRTS